MLIFDIFATSILKTDLLCFQHLNKTYKANVPLVLMNSFNTDDDTQKIIRKYQGLQIEIYTFQQSGYPRVNKDTLLPIATNPNIKENMEAYVIILLLSVRD